MHYRDVLALGFQQKVKRRKVFCLNYEKTIGKTFEKTCFSNILKKIFVFFHGHFCSFTGILFCFFHVYQIEFHGQDFVKNFTGTFVFSRALFYVFSGFFTGTFFFTGNFFVFFHGYDFFFHGEKKNTDCQGKI